MVRECCCARHADTCPVHRLGPWVAGLQPASKPFAAITGAKALSELRRRLGVLGIQNAENYVLHDIRRGHAQDLAEGGANLKIILAAGEWSSPAFVAYLDIATLEAKATVEAVVDESSDEEG